MKGPVVPKDNEPDGQVVLPLLFREFPSILLLLHNYLRSDPVEKEEAATGFS